MSRKLIITLILIVVALVVSGVIIIKALKPNNLYPVQDSIPHSSDHSWTIETFATNLNVPWDIGFDSNNNLYVTERAGNLRVIAPDGKELANVAVPNVTSVGESGLTGIALSPDFEQNQLIYLYYSYSKGDSLQNRVSSFTYRQGSLTNEKFIVDNLPGGSIHNGGRLRFGPDDKLWILTGDAAQPNLAQDKNSLAGKVLRVNADGSTPSDNPFPGSSVYSIGHRNPQGIAWQPNATEPIITEHGQSGHDEINLIKAGGNYGWTIEQECFSDNNQFISPILCSGNDTYAPSGLTALTKLPDTFGNSFLYSGLRGKFVERIEIKDGKIIEREKITEDEYGRMRAASESPDGTIYVATSNKDGRGNVRDGDDKILKIIFKPN